MSNALRLAALTVFLTLALTWSVGAQSLSSVLGLLATLDLSTLVPPDDLALTDPAANESATTDPPDPNAIAGAFRRLGDKVQVGMLTNQVELKYFLVGRTCGGGSPRIQLGISGDGNGTFDQFPGGPDQNAFGYLGNMPFGGGCLPNLWVHEDMTNSVPKWDLSQWTPFGASAFCGGNAMTCTWSQMVTFCNTVFPNHQVLNANLVDDAASFFVAGRGCAYFDLVTTGARTLNDHTDTSGGGKQPNNC